MEEKRARELLEEAKALCLECSRNCPREVRPRGREKTDSTAYKVECARQYLLYRIYDLGTSATRLLSQSSIVPGLILVRALIETAAVIYVLHREAAKALSGGGLDQIDEQITRLILGGRAVDVGYSSQNVLTFIDKVTKEVPQFRESYDQLCEFAHPNWSGCMGAYSRIRDDRVTLAMGPLKITEEESGHPYSLALNLLTVGLMIGLEKHKSIGELLN